MRNFYLLFPLPLRLFFCLPLSNTAFFSQSFSSWEGVVVLPMVIDFAVSVFRFLPFRAILLKILPFSHHRVSFDEVLARLINLILNDLRVVKAPAGIFFFFFFLIFPDSPV